MNFYKVIQFSLWNLFSIASVGKKRIINVGAYCYEIVTEEISLPPLRFGNCILG